MILAGQLLMTDSPGSARLVPGYIRVAGETIAEVVQGELPTNADHGNAQTLISPGFIDTHLHLPQFEMIGAHGETLLDWLSGVTFPTEQRWERVDYARSMTSGAIDQLFAHGTTAVCAYATVHYEATAAALALAMQRGLRGVIGQTLINRYAPPELTVEANRLIDETSKLIDRFPPTGRMAAAVTPRFAISCTPELLAAAGKLAAEHEAMIQSHLSETIAECDWVTEVFDGMAYPEVYRQAGLMTPKSIYGHGIYLDKADRQTLNETGAVIAHCPTANSFLRSGKMNRQQLLEDSVTMSLGSDIGAGYERSMVRVARAMIETAAAIKVASSPEQALPTAEQAWHQITAGNAKALGWQNAGVLRVGDPADLVLIEPTIPSLTGQASLARPRPLQKLMFAWDDRWVKQTWARGELVYEAS